jgi:hypothetical protein
MQTCNNNSSKFTRKIKDKTYKEISTYKDKSFNHNRKNIHLSYN